MTKNGQNGHKTGSLLDFYENRVISFVWNWFETEVFMVH